VTGSETWARVTRDLVEMVLRDFAAPDGGFASASDADAEGEEGRSFVWTGAELRERLGDQAGRFCRYYGASEEGHWEGVNVLHVPRPDEAEWRALAGARRTLLEARGRRVQPLRDDKVLASWNGLMIEALAFAGRVLDEPRWVAAAARAADFLLATWWWRAGCGAAGWPGRRRRRAFSTTTPSWWPGCWSSSSPPPSRAGWTRR